jgi:phosphoribosylformimino-5-aminoimidazole carboxamide ribotide isomerase
MDIIPVIDLKGGVVVHARKGERAHYRPMISPLAATCDPLDVVRGLLSVYPFRTLYVADLDAIARAGDNRAALRRLRAALPSLRLWVDNGMADRSAAAAWLGAGLSDIVIGSEAQTDCGLVRGLAHDPRVMLSLDFRGDTFQGPPDLLAEPSSWPRNVIAMTLARVGSGEGPDLARLCAIRDAAPAHRIHAAGGIRDAHDLEVLAAAGIAGALVASCLHDGRLRGPDIEKLQS